MRVKVTYPNLPEDFRRLVKEKRMGQAISIRQMARDLETQPATISQLERGDRNFSYDRAVQVRDYLNMKYDLPIPASDDTQVVIRNRNKHPLEKGDGFYLNVDGELIEVLTYRRLGSVCEAKHSSRKGMSRKASADRKKRIINRIKAGEDFWTIGKSENVSYEYVRQISKKIETN